MAEGALTYEGLAVPLYGESEIQQQTAATDILTLTGATSISGDFLVMQTVTGTERFVVEDGGNIVMAQSAAADIGLKITRYSTPTAAAIAVYTAGGGLKWAITKNYGVQHAVRTTRPTTGLTKGEMLILFHGSKPYIGICSSTVGQQIKLVRCKTKTFGRTTA